MALPSFCVSFCFTVLILSHDASTEVLTSSQCENTCILTFKQSKIACLQGCRLSAMIDVLSDGGGTDSINDIQSSCLLSCKDAYDNVDTAGVCAFGCQSQIPSIELRRKTMATLDDDEMSVRSSAFTNLVEYYRRMMDCMSDQFKHHFYINWFTYDDAVPSSNAKLTVVVETATGGDEFVNDVVVEHKTPNSLETNLAIVDRSATANLHISQVDGDVLVADAAGSADGKVDVSVRKDNWLVCLERRADATKKIVTVMVVLSLAAIFYFSLNALLPTSHVTPKVDVCVEADCFGPSYDDVKSLLPDIKTDVHVAGTDDCLTKSPPSLDQFSFTKI